MASWYLPYEYISVPIEAGNVNPFGVDPEQTMSILTGNAGRSPGGLGLFQRTPGRLTYVIIPHTMV